MFKEKLYSDSIYDNEGGRCANVSLRTLLLEWKNILFHVTRGNDCSFVDEMLIVRQSKEFEFCNFLGKLKTQKDCARQASYRSNGDLDECTVYIRDYR